MDVHLETDLFFNFFNYFRDPRSRMLLEQQERKLSGPKPTDGHKLSFAEKMKLFASEVRIY